MKEKYLLAVITVLAVLALAVSTNLLITGKQITEETPDNTIAATPSPQEAVEVIETASGTEEKNLTAIFSVQLHYNKGDITQEEITLLEGDTPDNSLEDFIDPKNAYTAKVLSFENQALYISKFEIELAVFDLEDVDELEETYVNLILPYFLSGKSIEIYNPDGELKLSIDISQYARPELVAKKERQKPKQIVRFSFDSQDIDGKIRLKDLSGNENSGIIKNAEEIAEECESGTKLVKGKIKNGLLFDGLDDEVGISHTDQLSFKGSRSFTISAWIKPVSREGSESQVIIRKKPPVFGDPWPYSLHFAKEKDDEPQNRRIQFVMANLQNETDRFISINSNSEIPLNEWTHVTASWDGNYMKIHINGLLENQIEFKGPVQESTTEQNPPRGLSVGSGEALEGVFNGIMDELYIFNGALTEEEIIELVNQKEVEEIKDDSVPIEGRVKTLTFEGLPDAVGIESVEGRFGKAAKFDSGFLTESLSVSDFRASSMDFWLKVPENLLEENTSETILEILDKETSDDSAPLLSLSVSAKALIMKIENSTSYNTGNDSVSGSYLFDEYPQGWVHVAITSEQTENGTKVNLYFANELKLSLDHSLWQDAVDSSSIILGSDKDAQNYFQGLLDELSIYDKTLSKDEIALLSKKEPFVKEVMEESALTVKEYLENKETYKCKSVDLTAIINSKYNCSECADEECACKTNHAVISDSLESAEEEQLFVNFFKDKEIYKKLRKGQKISINLKPNGGDGIVSNTNGGFSYNFLEVLEEPEQELEDPGPPIENQPENSIIPENKTLELECSSENPEECKTQEDCESQILNWCILEDKAGICQAEGCP